MVQTPLHDLNLVVLIAQIMVISSQLLDLVMEAINDALLRSHLVDECLEVILHLVHAVTQHGDLLVLQLSRQEGVARLLAARRSRLSRGDGHADSIGLGLRRN